MTLTAFVLLFRWLKSKFQKRVVLKSLSETAIKEKGENHTTENPADFSFSIIGGTSVLKGLDLSGASFKGSSCCFLSLEGCTLIRCDFSGATFLETVNFNSTTMDRATADTIRKNRGVLPENVLILESIE